MSILTLYKPNTKHYILIGDQYTWKIALPNNIWGFKEKSKGYWKACNIQDYLAFYVTSPIKTVIGFGIIRDKLIDENIVWLDEKMFGKSIYKYRIRFDILHVIKDRQKGIEIHNNIILNVGRKLIDKNMFLSLVTEADSTWKTNLLSKVGDMTNNHNKNY